MQSLKTSPPLQPSAYGVQLLFTLKGLVEDNGTYNHVDSECVAQSVTVMASPSSPPLPSPLLSSPPPPPPPPPPLSSPGFNAAKQADRLFKHFGPGTPFEETRKQKASPVQGTWTNHNIKIFLAKREEGEQVQSDSGSKDPDGLVKTISIMAMYHGKPELLAKVEECVTVTQVRETTGHSV